MGGLAIGFANLLFAFVGTVEGEPGLFRSFLFFGLTGAVLCMSSLVAKQAHTPRALIALTINLSALAVLMNS
jgi:hypothetical protein